MKPLLKWVGSKRRLIGTIKPLILQTHDPMDPDSRYIELFAGGAALYFDLQPRNGVIVDSCKSLMSFYEAIQRDPISVSKEIDKLKELPHSKDSYLKVRSEWDGNDFGVKFAAKLLYLNKLCFNGLFRLNSDLGFNVPWGKKVKQPAFPTVTDFIQYAQILKDASIYNSDFNTVLRASHAGDTIYIDPPYYNMYDKYSGSSFTNKDHERLAEGCFNAVQRGANIVASNIDCEPVRKLYEDWSVIDTIDVRHQVGPKEKNRSKARELIIVARSSTLDRKQMKLL